MFGRELRVCLKKRVNGNWERLQKPEVKRPQNERYDFDYVQDSSEDDVPFAAVSTSLFISRHGLVPLRERARAWPNSPAGLTAAMIRIAAYRHLPRHSPTSLASTGQWPDTVRWLPRAAAHVAARQEPASNPTAKKLAKAARSQKPGSPPPKGEPTVPSANLRRRGDARVPPLGMRACLV